MKYPPESYSLVRTLTRNDFILSFYSLARHPGTIFISVPTVLSQPGHTEHPSHDLLPFPPRKLLKTRPHSSFLLDPPRPQTHRFPPPTLPRHHTLSYPHALLGHAKGIWIEPGARM